MANDLLTWLGIGLCLSQAGMLSGLNLAVFSMSRLELEVEAAGRNAAAQKVLALREDANAILTTILWGNVAVNVLLALLADSVLAGVGAFLFSTFAITLFGEIAPQAYFTRHALKMVALLSPMLRFYQVLLYPVAKPTALVLDAWLGKEGIRYYREVDIKEIIRRHMIADETEMDRLEAIGALNFLTIDDMTVGEEGTSLDPKSVIRLPSRDDVPVFPEFEASPEDPFLRRVNASGRTWVVITDETDEPRLIMDADGFLRHALFSEAATDPYAFCHRPVIIRDSEAPLGEAIVRLHFDKAAPDDHLIRYDTILIWTQPPRLITGPDLLGRLLRGILKWKHGGR
ncbi:MAG: DUF21 domain-containing protein [Gammaproteobacteria bacterium]|nr:DUF21 domain-containing protein [Gammaproteobacteria bacterium]MBU1979444.1 DUF21 domain-containing protein [Gammaproteobacteria bacterium]